MSRMTIDECQARIAAVVDQDPDTGNLSSDDYSLRLKYLNMAQSEWANVSDWQQLYKEYNVLVSTSTGNASIVIPNDFKKLAGYPQVTYDGSTTDKFKQVMPQDDYQYDDTIKRVWVLGSPQGGYTLRIFGATLTSGASVKVPYYRSPISLATSSDISDVPNSDYLVQRTIAWIWESREDARFQIAKAEAERILSNMIEYEQVFGAAYDDRVKTVEETKFSFRIGRD